MHMIASFLVRPTKLLTLSTQTEQQVLQPVMASTDTHLRNFAVVGHSHSMVPGGLLVTSYTTLLTDRTELQILVETARKKAGSKGYQSAVIPSELVTALNATTWLCVLWSPCTPTDLQCNHTRDILVTVV